MKFRRHGVKREHSVIAEFARTFEQLAQLPGVSGVIPGRIANNPTNHPGLVLKTETPSGFKLLAKSHTSVQEVFLICQAGERAAVRQSLRPWITTGGPKPSSGRRRSPKTTTRTHPSGDPPRTRTARSFGALTSDKRLYRRLHAMRLGHCRWLRRYGVPARRVRKR